MPVVWVLNYGIRSKTKMHVKLHMLHSNDGCFDNDCSVEKCSAAVCMVFGLCKMAKLKGT
jgi:hypothetical protein